MSAKKLDLEKAIERELNKPKIIDSKQPADSDEVNIKRSKNLKGNLSDEIKNGKRLEPDSVVRKIDLGITPEKVVKIAGKPDSVVDWYAGNLRYQYGRIWIVIEDGKVTCMVHDEHFEKYWNRKKYQEWKPEALIK